jgi:hypothetical protein
MSSGRRRLVDLLGNDVSEERTASIVSVNRISELGATLAVASNCNMLRRINHYMRKIQWNGVHYMPAWEESFCNVSLSS